MNGVVSTSEGQESLSTAGGQSRIRLLRGAGPAAWLAILALAVAWRAQHLGAFSLSNDEGAHLMWARLAADGYALYSETQAVQAPLFIETIALAFRLAGPQVEAGRWVILASFGLLAAVLSWLAYREGRWPASLVALVLLSLSPLSFSLSRLVMAEVPATALAALSMGLALVFRDRRRRGWLLASGLALGLSFLTKALYPFLLAPVGLLVWQARHERPPAGSRPWRAMAGDGLVWAAGIVAPLILTLALYPPAALYEQLVAFRGDIRAAAAGSAAETWAYFGAFLSSHWGLWLASAGAAVLAVVLSRYGWWPGTARGRDLGAWLAWLAAGAAMLGWHAPLFPHHFVLLLPPLCLLAAWYAAAVGQLWRLRRPSGRWGTAIRWAALFIGAAAVFNAPAMVAANRETAAIVTGGREAEGLALLRAVSSPDDFLMGDSQLLIFMAGRRTPPPLGDVALVAIKAGRQTPERMIALTEKYSAPAVAQWSLRLAWLPEYLEWVQANYLARRVWDNDHIIYYGLRLPPGQAIPNERAVRLGEAVLLRGYRTGPAPIPAGGDLNLKVYWQATAPLDRDYTIFTQLLDRNGALVAGWDSQPLGGYLPTGQWPVDEIVTDVVSLPVPAGTPAGQYRLITGMYLLETLERLPNLTETGYFSELATITIE